MCYVDNMQAQKNAKTSTENQHTSSVNYQLVQHDVEVHSDNENDIEMTAFIEKEGQPSSGSDDDDDNNESSDTSGTYHTPWYIIGLVILVTGVVLSQYHVHLPYEAECDDMYNDNFTNSTTPDPTTNYTYHTNYS